jgi:hypothetical protein
MAAAIAANTFVLISIYLSRAPTLPRSHRGGFHDGEAVLRIVDADTIQEISVAIRASAPARLRIGVADFVATWEASDHKEVSHEQEVHR